MSDSDKSEVRANVKFLTKLGWEKPAIIEAITKVYGDDAPSTRTVYRWIARFTGGREDIEDDPRTGRPSTSVNEDNVDAVRQIVEADRRVTVEEIAGTLGVSVGSVEEILHDHLHLSKLSARWVPKALRDDQKAQRAACAVHFLNKYDADPHDFLDRLVTGDETWIYQYDPETKIQGKQWLLKGGKGPINFKSARTVGKVMATVFWDADGVILVDWLEHQRTVTGPYYEGVLRKLHDALVKKRPGKLHHRVLFQHDNAPAHSSRQAHATLREFRWEILPHPPYSPDLAPCNFFLFPKLKEHIKGVHWESISEVQKAVIDWFKSKDQSFYRDGLSRWRHRYEKCLELDGSYVEK
jgi:histone-lysine N-methyltransferase SETMAR